MPNPNTDSKGYSTENLDENRDAAAKGGPTTTPGQSENKHAVPHPYTEDLQTQITAKGGKKKEEEDK